MVQPVYQYGYDLYGNQETITDPMGRVTTFTFDEFNRQVSRALPMTPTGEEERQFYVDSGVGAGQLDYMVDFEGRVMAFVYDKHGKGYEYIFLCFPASTGRLPLEAATDRTPKRRHEKRHRIRQGNRTRGIARHRMTTPGKRKTPRFAGLFDKLRQGAMTLTNT